MNKILLVTKTTPWCQQAINIVCKQVGQCDVVQGDRTDPCPNDVISFAGDGIISFLSPWIIPDAVLKRVKWAVNFHPAPGNYPGIGCYNFALYDQVKVYGVTAHHMNKDVDTGKIIRVKYFDVTPDDTVWTLKEKSMTAMIALLDELKESLVTYQWPDSSEQWLRKPFTRKQLDDLCRLDLTMTKEEIKKRIRATVFPGAPGPYFQIDEHRFILRADNERT